MNHLAARYLFEQRNKYQSEILEQIRRYEILKSYY